MANNSPTIVAASLSDDQLKKSIESLVTHVDEAMKKMVQSTNNAVGEMEAKLKSLGNLKIDSGSSNDGGTGRRTQQHEKLTKAVNDASEAVSKETQKLQDLQQSLSGASDREQNFISQKERAASTIAQENELLSKQQSELAALKTQQSQITQEVEKYAQASRNASSLRTKYEKSVSLADQLEKDYEKLKSMPDQGELLKKYNKDVEKFAADLKANLEKVRSARRESIGFGTTDNWLSIGSVDTIARHGIDKYTKDYIDRLKEIARKELYSQAGDFDFKAGRTDGLKEIRQYIQDIKSTRERLQGILKSKDFEFYKPEGLKAAIQYYKDIEKEYTAIEKRLSGLYGKYQTAMSAPDNSVKIADAQTKLSQAYSDVVVNAKAVTKAEGEVFAAREKSAQASQQKAQIDAQVAAKEKEIAETKGRIATATREQTEAEKNASQAAKEKTNILSQVANQEKRVAEAKKQLTTETQQHTEAETKSSRATKEKIMTLDQQASAINTAVQSEKKYTDEVLRQAAAIRSSKEWQEKGHVIVGDVNYYDKERANVSKRDKQLLLSLEEQIVQAQQNEAEAARRAAQETRNQAQAQQQVQQSALGTARIIESVHEMQRRSANFQKGNASVPTFTVELESAKRLSDRLKELREQYNNMNFGQRFGKEGQAIAQQIREITRQGQKLNNELNRPTKKEVFGLSEKTLDDIAYKMQRLRAYKQGIDLTKPNAANEIKQVDEALAKLQKDADKWMSKSNEMIKSNTTLGRSWNYMKNRLAFYFTVGAGTQFIKNLIEVRSQYEMNERALGILIDSAERGTRIFNELSQMALVSPYTLIELSAAAKQLTAYDVAAKDVVDTTRRLADMAAAVGIPIERLTYALGQIKAYGYLNSRDARMFANAGIPLVKQLADYYTELEGKLVSTADIYDRIKKKAIGYNDVMSVMYKMTDEGGKFFDFQAKMADTLKVRLANLTLAWNNMLNDMGKESQGILTWGIGALRELFLQWKTFDKTLKEAAGAFGLYKVIQLIILGLQTATKSTLGLNARLTATGVLGTRLVTIFKALGSAMKSLAANWWLILVAAAVELSSAIINANEATKEFNKSMREGAESTANDLKKYIEQYKDLRDSLYKTQKTAIGTYYPSTGKATTIYAEQQVGQDIDKNEASKAWEAMREQIELSSAASNDFVSRLLQIENVSDRLREGFKIIDDIQQVNAALKDMGDEALVVTQKWSAWWNAWQAPDGLFTNLKEFKVELDEIRQKYGDIENARYVAKHGDINRAKEEQDAIMRAASEAVNDYDRELNRFRVDLDKYTTSLDNFANAMEFSSNPTQVAELYAKGVKQLVTQGQLNPQEAFDLQLQIEEARTNAMKLALQSRIADEESALKLAQDERTKESLNASIESNKAQLKLFENSTYEQTAYWNDFTKYIKERHISELTAAYNAMTENGKKEMDFQSVEWQNYVHKWANSYEKSHNLATDSVFNRIKNWINDANTWSIFIKMTISTEDKKSVYKQLGEYDKAIDEADAQIERLTKRINELNAKKKKSKEETKELADAENELTQAQKDKADAEAKGGHGKKEKKDEKAANKAAKQAETELQKAIKDELSTIEKVRSIYNDLTKEGMSHANAVERATRGWDETVNAINRVLQKNGLQKLDLSKFAGIENPRELVNMLQSQLNTLLKRGAKPAEIKELQTKVNTLEVDADKYDLTKITKGLNNELGKLKDEYELAVELDANPEMGNLFADWMGIDTNELPRTFQEVVRKAQQGIDKVFAENNRTDKIDIASMLNKESFDKWVKDSGLAIDSELVKAVEQFRQYLHKTQVDENKKMTDEWSKLVEKYGDLQAKILKIYKDSLQEQIGIVRKFGDSGEVQEALDLSKKINFSQDPAEITRLQEQLANIIKSVVARNPQALDISTAVENKGKSETAKAYWEDFKNSELYTMTFEDMANNSTRAIQLIMDKLEGLKDKVKEDPASMKALIKSLEDAEKELNARDPFGGVARSLRDMANASQEAKTAQEALWRAEVDVEQAQQKVKDSEGGSPEEQKAAQDALAQAVERRANAQVKLTQAENKGKKAQENLKTSLQGISNQLGNVQELFGVVSKLFRAGGDDETADAIDAISEGFSVMTTVIMGVVAAMIVLQSTTPWLLAIAAALSVIVGLVSFLSGNSDKKIVAQIKDSERAVKRLENAYKELEYAAENAFGAATSGAQEAIKANKELQLAELKRQLALEQSRDSKHRDEDRIIEISGQIIDLEHEIKDFTKNAVNDLLGISSHGDFFESMISEMIEAFKNGEDAMEVFEEKWSDMIDNMIMKTIVSQVLSQWVKTLEHGADEILEKYTEESSKKMADIANEMANLRTMDAGDASEWIYDNDRETFNKILESLGVENVGDMIGVERWAWFNNAWGSGLAKKIMDAYLAMLDNNMAGLQDKLDKESLDATGELIDYYGEAGKEFKENYLGQILDKIQENWNFGQDSEKQLSNLQQGIQGISENTAGALEAYMNGVSQQVYLHSDLLTQIRDAVVGMDMDIQVATQAQMLLQLQQSYAVQMAIQGILEGVLNPSGRAFSVELVS